MRLPNALLALLCLPLFAVTAHAATYTFVFSATGGPTLTFNYNPATLIQNPAQGFIDVTQATDGQEVEPIFLYPSLIAAMGFGPADLRIDAYDPYFDAVYNGPQLFTGPDGPPFIDGVYDLTYNSYYGAVDESGTATLTITGATPEPSSFVLLGTGILAAAGAARRRFV